MDSEWYYNLFDQSLKFESWNLPPMYFEEIAWAGSSGVYRSEGE